MACEDLLAQVTLQAQRTSDADLAVQEKTALFNFHAQQLAIDTMNYVECLENQRIASGFEREHLLDCVNTLVEAQEKLKEYVRYCSDMMKQIRTMTKRAALGA